MSDEIDQNWLPPDPVDPSWPPPQPNAGNEGKPEHPDPVAATGWLRRNSVWVAALAGLLGVGVGALVVLAIVPRASDQAPPKAAETNTQSTVAMPPAPTPARSQAAPAPAPVGQPVPNPYSGPGQNVKTASGRVQCYVTATGEGTGNHRPRYCQDLWMRLFQATSVSVDSPFSTGVMSTGRSSSLPLWNTAPARTRATKCGAFTARQRACAASISL